MTRADHHHPDCMARQSTDDNCNCSWLIEPELPLEKRYMLRDVDLKRTYEGTYTQ